MKDTLSNIMSRGEHCCGVTVCCTCVVACRWWVLSDSAAFLGRVWWCNWFVSHHTGYSEMGQHLPGILPRNSSACASSVCDKMGLGLEWFCALCLPSPSPGACHSWEWQLRVPSRATSCSAGAAEWCPVAQSLWWLVFMYCCGQSLTNHSSSQFLKLDLSLLSSVWVISLYTLWESCGLFLYLDHHKVFVSALSWCSWWLVLELLLFSLFWNCSFLWLYEFFILCV